MCDEERPKTPSITGTKIAIFRLDLSERDISELPKPNDNEDDQNEDSTILTDIRSLDISKNKFNSLEFIEQIPNVIDLNASHNEISDGIALLDQLRFLTSINLAANLFENISGFPALDTLTHLDISNNHLSTAKDIPLLPNLKILNLSNNAITQLDLTSQPLLQILDISNNELTSLSLPKLPSLRSLNASHNQLQSIDKYEEEDLPYLCSLDVSNNQFESPDVFESISKLPLLFDLKIKSNPLEREDQSHIPPILVILPGVTELNDEVVNAKNKVKADLSVNGKEPEEEA